MKQFIAFFMMGIFAFAFTAVRATDTSPAHQKFSIEKVCLQASVTDAVVSAQVAEIQNSFIASSQRSAEQILTYFNFMEKKNFSEAYYSPGWLVLKNYKLTPDNYRGKIFISARLIPYSRDRS